MICKSVLQNISSAKVPSPDQQHNSSSMITSFPCVVMMEGCARRKLERSFWGMSTRRLQARRLARAMARRCACTEDRQSVASMVDIPFLVGGGAAAVGLDPGPKHTLLSFPIRGQAIASCGLSQEPQQDPISSPFPEDDSSKPISDSVDPPAEEEEGASPVDHDWRH